MLGLLITILSLYRKASASFLFPFYLHHLPALVVFISLIFQEAIVFVQSLSSLFARYTVLKTISLPFFTPITPIFTTNMHFSSTFAVSALLALTDAAVMGKRALSGEATFYGGNVAGGMCSLSTYTLPSNVFGTALSDSNWDNSANCGACVSVTGPGGNSVTAMALLSFSLFSN